MKRISRTTKYIIILCVFLFAANVSLGYLLTRQSREALRSQIENRMLDVANTAAAMLDGDVLETLEAEDVNTPEYQAALRTLYYFEENIELEYIYCVRDMGDKNFVFMIDPDPDSPGAFGEHIPYTDALYEASFGTPAVDQEPYVDSWGRFYSAYSPVFDSRGKVAGIVAVDFSADWYEQQISQLLKTTLTFSGVSILFAAVIIFLITARFRNRFGLLFREMNQVSDGIETLVREVNPRAKTETKKPERETISDDGITALGEKLHDLQQNLSEQISFVRSQAYVDGLTGLGNRTAYEEQVRQIEDEIKEGTAGFAVAVFDLNGLKEINDNYGHDKGDQAIVSAAAEIRFALPEAKHYRIGGDEFSVILTGEELEAQLTKLRAVQRSGLLSMGGAVYDSDSDMDFRMVFNRADTEMYNAKKAYYQSRGDRRKKIKER